MTTRADGDARPTGGTRGSAQAADPAWTNVHQVHGSQVVLLDTRQGPMALEADALVTAVADVPLAVFGADCPLLGLASKEGVIAAVHAGWRGLAAGVIEQAVEKMRGLGATKLEAVLSPCIHPECYPFDSDRIDELITVLGPGVRGETSSGEPALDLPEAVAVVLERAGVTLVGKLGGCTACSPGWFSHRARADAMRHALVIWRTEEMSSA